MDNVSIETVLSGILMELPTQPTSQDMLKIKYFIQDACKLLSVHKTLQQHDAVLNVVNGRATLPDNIIVLMSVWKHDTKTKKICRLLQNHSDHTYLGDETYEVNGNYIFVGDRCVTEIGIKYTAPEIDCNGFWMVPDNAALKEAITWFVDMKLAKMGYPGLKVNHQYASQQFEQIWGPRAVEELKRFTPEDAETLKVRSTKLIWDYDKWQMFGQSEREHIKFG